MKQIFPLIILFIFFAFCVSENDLLPTLKECGALPSIVVQVQGFLGYELLFTAYLHPALLEYENDGNSTGYHCGGSIINERYILTAAHCVTGEVVSKYGKPYRARLGEFNRDTEKDVALYFDNEEKDNVEDIDIEEIITHQMYNVDDINRYYDIALIRLKHKYTKKEFIQPVCFENRIEEINKQDEDKKKIVAEENKVHHDTKTIKHKRESISNKSVDDKNEEVIEKEEESPQISIKDLYVLLGWSVTENDNGRSDKRFGLMKSISNEECEKHINMTLIESQFCVIRYNQVPADDFLDQICHGDSGGGLIQHDTGVDYYLIGIDSIRFAKCDQKFTPNVYTNVTQFIPWIEENLRP